MTEIKRCPCGEEAKAYSVNETYNDGHAVECVSCGLTLPASETEEEAIKEWNEHPMHRATTSTDVTQEQRDHFKFIKSLCQLTK